MRPARGSAGERGMALVIVLWFTVAIASLAMAFGALARGEALRSRNMVDAITARALLRGALDRAVSEILAPTAPAPATGVTLDWQLAGATLAIEIRGESGKVDLNTAEAPLLRALVQALGRDEAAAARFADAVLDWRDEDALRLPQGAEQGDYRLADRPGAPADAPFLHAAELREVLPVDRALYRRLRPLVTVSTGQVRPDLDRAPEIVRNALLGLKDENAEDEDEEEPSDEAPPETEDAEPGAIQGVSDPARVFALRLDVRLANGYEAHADAVVWLVEGDDGRPYSILDWEPSPLRGEGDG